MTSDLPSPVVTPANRTRGLATALLVLSAWLLPTAIVFGPILATSDSFAFRDAAHYYPPLLKTIWAQWPDQLPLWNPNEERGRPLLADPTAAVLYPAQLIFALPLDFDTAYKWYVVGHVLLCCVTSFVAARRLGLATDAATLASVAYAFGGSIVFQYCNIPYLIGAAWLPLGVSSVLGLVHGRSPWSVLEMAGVLTLMVLGGDPQTAYLLGALSLVAAALAVLPLGRELGWRRAARPLGNIVTRLVIAGTLAIGLSAAQWLPTAEWAAIGERLDVSPWAAATTDGNRVAPDKPPLEHKQTRYQFSIGPWRWTEMFWPNASGRMFPRNERWITAIPAEGRVWAPSLYLGILPLLMGAQALRFRGGRLADRWLSWLVLFGVLGSLGRYGVGWALAETSGVLGTPPSTLPDGTGGLYWCLTVLLPGFGLFRYPAKLWTWAAIGLSLLAGIRLHDATHQRRRAVPLSWISAYLIVSVLGFVLVAFAPAMLDRWWSFAPDDPLFGPLAVSPARKHLLGSLANGILVGGLAWLGLRWLVPSAAGNHRTDADCGVWSRLVSSPGWTIVAITVVELSVSSRWMVPRAGLDARNQRPGARSAVTLADPPDPLTYRLPARTWYPRDWPGRSSDDRVEECMIWDRWTARPKYPLESAFSVLRSSTSFSSRDHKALLGILDDVYRTAPADFVTLLEQLGVGFVCGADVASLPGLQPVAEHPFASWANEAKWYRVAAAQPRAWIVHDAEWADAPEDHDSKTLHEHLRRIFRPNGIVRDLLRQVTLETERGRPRANLESPSDVSGEEYCEVLSRFGSCVVVKVHLQQAGWLVLNESYAPGWNAIVRGTDGAHHVPVLRANRVMRAVALPQGDHRVTLRYRPTSVRWGLRVSGLSVVLLIPLVAFVLWRR